MTPEFARFVAPAAARSGLWRTLVGFFAIVVLWFLLAIPILILADPLIEVIPISPRSGDALELLAAVGMLLPATVIITRILHKRGSQSLFGDRRSAFRDAGIAFMVPLALVAMNGMILPVETVQSVSVSEWAPVALIALVFVLLQVSGEEALFRSYLLQQLGVRFQSAIIYAVIPSIIFGLLHFDPTLPPMLSFALVGSIVLFALTAVDLVRVTGSVAAAIGLHAGVNVHAILLVSAPDIDNSALALFHTPLTTTDSASTTAFASAAILWTVIDWLLIRATLIYLSRRDVRRGTHPEAA